MAEIARQFGVNTRSIYRAILKLEHKATRSIVLNAPDRTADYSLTLLTELFDDVKKMKTERDRWIAYLHGDREGFQQVHKRSESRSLDQGVGGGGEERGWADRRRKIIERVESFDSLTDANSIVIQYNREKRELERLIFDVMSKIADMRNVALFRRHMLDVIGQIDPNARDEIIRRLQSEGALRGAFMGDSGEVGR